MESNSKFMVWFNLFLSLVQFESIFIINKFNYFNFLWFGSIVNRTDRCLALQPQRAVGFDQRHPCLLVPNRRVESYWNVMSSFENQNNSPQWIYRLLHLQRMQQNAILGINYITSEPSSFLWFICIFDPLICITVND